MQLILNYPRYEVFYVHGVCIYNECLHSTAQLLLINYAKPKKIQTSIANLF
jgi:hypothetical protein